MNTPLDNNFAHFVLDALEEHIVIIDGDGLIQYLNQSWLSFGENNGLLDNMKFRSGLASEIDRAINCGEMELHYQPQFDLKTQEIIGAEALIRWRDPASGWIPPDKFIPVLEEIGQMYTLGSWVALEAADFLEKTTKKLNFSGKIAINVSGINVRDGNLADYIKDAISISGCTPHQLEIEITESIIMTNNTIALQQLEALQNIGISVAIDDFGTGYSSLGQLKNFPVNKLKIDRTFIDNLTDGLNDRAIIKAIISLAKTLNLKVIAEGIETAEQLAILIEEGCDYGQGYFLGRPIPKNEFEKILQNKK